MFRYAAHIYTRRYMYKFISLTFRALVVNSSDAWRTVSRGRDPALEQGQSQRSPPPQEEGAAETRCDELTATPIPHPPAPLGGRR